MNRKETEAAEMAALEKIIKTQTKSSHNATSPDATAQISDRVEEEENKDG